MTTASARRATEALRNAVLGLLAAERRLRSRDHEPGELTFAQLRSIVALGRTRQMTAGQLARSADLNPATVTAMLDHLEAAGIVQRERSTTDRRVCNVALTDTGRELFEHKQARWLAVWAERMRDFTEDDLDTAARVMGAITELFDSMATKDPAREDELRRAPRARSR